MCGWNIQAVGVADVEGDGARDQILFHKIETHEIHHFFDDEPSLLEGIVTAQNLSAGKAVCAGTVVFDIGNGDGFPAPRMVDQKLRVHPEQFIQQVFIRAGNIAHGADAEGVEPSGGAGTHAPEVREGLVGPEGFAVAFLREFADKIIGVFGGDIQCNFRQIQVGAYAAGGAYAGLFIDILHDPEAELSGGEPVEREIIRHIHESLVDGVDMDVRFGNIFQVDGINIRGDIHISLHTGRRHDIFYGFRNFKNAAAVFDSQRFHGGGDGKADGFFRPRRVCHDQIGGHGVQTPLHAFHRGVKRF